VIPASVLAVVVQAQGIAKTNAGLMSVHKNATRSATAARGASNATAALGKTSAGAATGISKQAQAANAAAAANGRVTASANAATAAQTSQAKAAHAAGVVAGRAGQVSKNGGLALVAAAGLSIKAAADFESSFAEVEKTVDTNERGFARLEAGLRDLAKGIPLSVNELNDLAGQAGALGIASKDIVEFTKTAAELGIATDLSASDAANALARLSNIMGTSSKDFRRLGSTFVQLGNDGASTEREIADMALRLAATGKQVGLNEAQVLSFSSALSSVGINAEAGGSAFSTAFSRMALAVEKGGKQLKGFASVAGMGADEFATAFEDNAALAMVKFVEGLGRIRKEGGSALLTLDDLNIKEIRLKNALLSAAGAGGMFRDQLKTGTAEWKRNVALTAEANKRYETTAAQYQMLKNGAIDWAIGLGQDLLPTLKSVMEILRNPKLDADQKFERIMDILNNEFGRALERAAEAAGRHGPRIVGQLASSIAGAWADMNPFAKLLTAAVIIRAVGGKGALTATGATIGRWIGGGVQTGVASGVAGGAAAGVTSGLGAGLAGAGAAGAASGAFTKFGKTFEQSASGVLVPAGVAAGTAGGSAAGSRFMSTMTGTLLPIAKRASLAAVGVALVNGIVEGAAHQGELDEKLGALISGATLGLLPGPREIDERMATIVSRIKSWTDGPLTLSDPNAPELSLIREDDLGDFTRRQQAMLSGMAQLRNRANELFGPGSRLIPGAWLNPQKTLSDLQVLDGGLQKLKAGVFTSTNDIARVSRRNMQIVSNVLGRGTAEGRRAAADNLRATARAFRIEMQRSGAWTKEAMRHHRQLIREADLRTPTRAKAQQFGREWARGMDRSKEITKGGVREMIREAQRMPAPMRQVALQTWNHQITQARRGGKITKGEAQDMRSKVQAAFQGIELSSRRKSKGSADAVIGNTARMVNQSSRGFDILGSNANSALRAFGVKELQYEVRKFSPQGKQTGGFIVPGVGSGDKFNTTVPVGSFVLNREATRAYGLQRGGMAPVALEPGERVFYPDEVRRVGKARLHSMNSTVSRFQTGGFVELLHPFNDPEGHGGGNSHLHMAMLDIARLIAVGRMLQRQGWLVSEHPAFGGVNAHHAKNSYHYRGMALDVNWPDPGQEAAKIRAVLANLGVLATGGLEGALDQVPKLILSGSGGPLRDLGQASIDTVRRAANSYLSKHAMVAGTGEMFGGASMSTKPGLMRLWREAGGNPAAANLAAAVALAESGGNQFAKNVNANGTIDRGYWQINSIHGALSTFNELGNASAAVTISGNGTNWNPWVAYQKGLHAQYLRRGGAIVDPLGLIGGGTATASGKKNAKNRGRRPRFARQLDQALGVVRKTGDKRKHRKAFHGVFKTIKGLGLDRQQQKLAALTDIADRYGEYAQNAATLSTTDADGNEIAGVFQGKDQGHWLNAQLQALLDLRNKLIAVEKQVVAKQARAAKLAQIAQKRLRAVQKQIRAAARHKREVAGQIREAEKALEVAEKHPKRNKVEIKQLKGRIKNLKGTDREIDRRQKDRVRVRDALTGTGGVITRIKKQQGDLRELRGNVLGQGNTGWKGLAAVQGIDGPMVQMGSLPPIGTLGGEILTAQSSLRELGRQPDVSASSDSEHVRLLEDQLRLANQRTLVANSQFAILRDFQLPGFAGMFAQGGVIPRGMWGIAGETGRPEIVHGPASIYNPADTAAMLAGGSEREIRVVVEDRRVIVQEDGREIEAIIDDRTTKLARRGQTRTPGGSRL
jgi:TP901 family phage tail tape measure protein